eukprot:NODE_1118_length_1064_cov_256.447291_g769_i0.p1 GENE.NODE_1118_length_1064_cov_256.447291_g769_i0~~NODE_1118_length_1064_cov_256.447291_g769_i0.p1  ORF type:complete len:286 (-),score=121.15 NODE_1118_length_1064_cov_256.447291_g769_i0:115-972(-)
MSSRHTSLSVGVFGAEKVGKTSLVLQFIQQTFPTEYDPTLEDNYCKQTSVKDAQFVLNIVDTAGQDELAATRPAKMETCQVFIVVYSVGDRASFERAKHMRTQIVAAQEALGKAPEKVPLLLVANFTDGTRLVSTEEGQALAAAFRCPFFEASAKTRTNIVEIFEEAVLSWQKCTGVHGDGCTRGWLTKGGGGALSSLRQQRRWFKLQGHHLCYFTSEGDEGTTSLGQLDLRGAGFVPTADALTFKIEGPLLNKDKKDKVYFLTADNKEEYERWKLAVAMASKQT